jgi:hypothetical protein
VVSVGSVTSIGEYLAEKRRAAKVAANERPVAGNGSDLWWDRLASDSRRSLLLRSLRVRRRQR